MRGNDSGQLAGRFRVSVLRAAQNLTGAVEGKHVDRIHRFIGIYPYRRWPGRRILPGFGIAALCRIRGLDARAAQPASTA